MKEPIHGMIVPDDLTIDARQQRIILTSGGRVVEIVNESRFGPFANGPIKWTDLQLRWLIPALAQFQRTDSSS